MARFSKRLLLIAVVLAGVATGVGFAFGDRIAAGIVRQAVARATQLAAARGVELREVRFARAQFAGMGAIRCTQLSARVHLTRPGAIASRPLFVVLGADDVMIDLGGPWSDRAEIAVRAGRVNVFDETGVPTGDALNDVRVRTDFPFSWFRARDAVDLLEDEVRRLVREGRSLLPIDLQATAEFTVLSRPQQLAVHSEPDGEGGTRIALDRLDLERLSRGFFRPLTESEMDLLARYPHLAPALLRISEQATRSAFAEKQRNRKFPYDAYRHVYWSWLLTREFGPEFAETVTNAHEEGATYEFGSANRRMDEQNNAVGRAYALAGVAEDQIVRRVLTDPDVIRAPEDAE